MADYEVSEYRDLEDLSIYVLFPIRGKKNEYLLIWTTTPWTLPSNVFVMVHPDMDYLKVRVGGKVLLLAEPRLREVMEEAGVKEYEVLGSLKGRELVGLRYDHPLRDLVDIQKRLDDYHRVVAAPEAVTPYEGTGIVHAATGHGDVDFEIGRRLGFPVVSLVDDQGRFVDEAGKYRGLYFREANDVIVSDLRELGALFHQGRVVHRYPVCWRCKTPLLLRATKQWFIRVSRLRDKLLKEAGKVRWIPDWAYERFANWLKSVKDWVISRQRYWGTPLPIWRCERCGRVVVVGSREDLRKLGASKIPDDLHRPYIDEIKLRCNACGGVMSRVPDVLDVWFDSGVAFYASLGYPKSKTWDELRPVDFVVEGHDQTRGWFFSLLRSGVIGFDSTPLSTVLVHGFMLDERGREMHKSLGNYVEPEEVISKYGRDVFRLWVLSNTVWEDIKFSWKGLSVTRRDLTVAWNVFKFASTYMHLDGFDPKRYDLSKMYDSMRAEDRWLVSITNRLVREVSEAMENYRLHEAARALRSFMVEDVSHWYVRLIRRRAWEEERSPEKLGAYVALYNALRTWLLLLAPIAPFFAEQLYLKFLKPAEELEEPSIHLLSWPDYDESLIDEALERDMSTVREVVEAALAARMRAGVKLRQPLPRLLIATAEDRVLKAIKRLEDIILEQANVKRVEVYSPKDFEEFKGVKAEPILVTIGREFKSKASRVVELVKAEAKTVAESIVKRGFYEATVDGEPVRLEARHVRIKVEYPEWMSVAETKWGLVAVDTRLSREEMLEGIARDVIRRVQFMRNRLRLPVDSQIVLSIETDDADILEAVRKHVDYIMQETRSVEVRLEPMKDSELAMEWDVRGASVKIYVKRRT